MNRAVGTSEMDGQVCEGNRYGSRKRAHQLGSERVSMELTGSATWPVGWDRDLGGVFNGRALRGSC